MNGEGADTVETGMVVGPPKRERERVRFYPREFVVAQNFAQCIKEEFEKDPKFQPCIVRQFCEIMVRQ